MKKETGVRRYIYWANRRVLGILGDQGVGLNDRKQRKISTPNIKSFLPVVEWVVEYSSLTKPQLASKVESVLGDEVVSDLGSPAPICFARGQGSVAFGEFVGADTDMAMMYIPQRSSRGDITAVCLFGSVENYSDFVSPADGPVERGWTSSASGSIYKFLQSECRVTPSRWENRENMAREAVKIAAFQGLYDQPAKVDHPQRGYMYGDVLHGGEWFAEIYQDFDLAETLGGPQDGHGRVLIGAPLWLRTATPSEMRLYSDMR
ncbi:hypothetical protein [Amycolatopsis sp. GA6-003]|uniref:hypothetical protein n=1 Tax=Amycolatopsis sp. GA6-003 TaxID=2652444 RepID=UPI0039171001